MAHKHDFKRFPELTNSQMDIFYFESPHKQITEDFEAKVVKIIDGDTVKVKWSERNFDFPIRIQNLAAPEKKETGGKEAKEWLENKLLNEIVRIILSKQRVEKWGRILADIIHQGINISEEIVWAGHGVPWDQRKENSIANLNEILKEGEI